MEYLKSQGFSKNWMVFLGIAGVSSDEKSIALKVEKFFRSVIVIFIALIPMLWYGDQHSSRVIGDWVSFISWGVWIALLIETFLLLVLIDDRRSYIRANWMILPIIILTFPMLINEVPYAVLLRALQFVIFARALSSALESTQKLFRRSHLGAIIIGYFFIIVASGITIHSIDPNITSAEDGLWWAIVTMATLGYGDVVPVSTEGRLFAALIIILGAVFFSLLTAQIAAYMVGEDGEAREDEILRISRENNQKLSQMMKIEDVKIEDKLEEMSNRIARLEKMVTLLVEHSQNKR